VIARIVAAAKLANTDEFVVKMTSGYETMIGERGLRLSGGQGQRIGIARAFIRDAPILIMDGIVVEHGRRDDLLTLGGTCAGVYWTSQVARPELQGSHHTQLTGANLAWRAH
jgi:hypothetical protein